MSNIEASKISNELVALYLLANIAAGDHGKAVNVKDGVPIIAGASKEWLLTNYVDCLRAVIRREVKG